MQTEIKNKEYDLSEGDDIVYRQNNVCVVLEELPPELSRKSEDDDLVGKDLFRLLRGRKMERSVLNTSNDNEMIFKLLTLNEFDQGIVNISYSYDLNKIIPPSGFPSFQIFGLEEVGLFYNSKTHTIEGVPNQLGTFQIGIQFDVKGSPFSKLINLRVITLWKEIDPPEDILFPKENTASQSIVIDEYGKKGLKNLLAGSIRGRSHANDGKTRDDDFQLLYEPQGNWYLVAVSDGAGSARYSREGSKILSAIQKDVFGDFFAGEKANSELAGIIEEYKKSSDEEIFFSRCRELLVKPLKSMITRTLNEFSRKCKNIEGSHIEDFSTTSLIAVAKKVGCDWLIFTYNVGDGAIALINDRENYVAVLCNPDEGKYFGQTRFITTQNINTVDDIRERVTVHFVHSFDALMLMTDGVSDPKFPSDKNLHDSREWISFYREFSSQVSLYASNDEIEQQLLDYLGFWSIGNHDDRTLAMIY